MATKPAQYPSARGEGGLGEGAALDLPQGRTRWDGRYLSPAREPGARAFQRNEFERIFDACLAHLAAPVFEARVDPCLNCNALRIVVTVNARLALVRSSWRDLPDLFPDHATAYMQPSNMALRVNEWARRVQAKYPQTEGAAHTTGPEASQPER